MNKKSKILGDCLFTGASIRDSTDEFVDCRSYVQLNFFQAYGVTELILNKSPQN